MPIILKLNVTNIGDKLKEELEKRGIGTVVDKTDVQANLTNKGLSYAQSYQESRTVVEAAVSGNRDLTYLIDIHRDSRRKKDTTKEINGKSYAKLAFIVGGEHANYEKNLAFANQLHEMLEQKYNGLVEELLRNKVRVQMENLIRIYQKMPFLLNLVVLITHLRN